jgi:cortexillin 1/2
MAEALREKDRGWEHVQEKAFTSWLNETLSQRNMHVADLRTDLTDGVILANFLELLAGKKIGKRIEKTTSRIQKIQNLVLALTFLEQEMIKNPGCSAEDVVDTETRGIKLVLGLMWTLFRKYRIAVIQHKDKSSEEGLLAWCKSVTDGYSNVHIESWKTSFKDGLAFLAMIHRFNPDKTNVVYSDYHKDEPERNLTVAFEMAEKEMGIPKLLDVQEVMDGKVDERSLVLYTSLFFHAFRAAEVASSLTKEKLSTEEQLAMERKKNEELMAINAQLEERINQLTSDLSSTTQKLEFKMDEFTKLVEEYKAKDENLQFQVKTLSGEVHEKQETNLQLTSAKGKLEQDLEEVKLSLQNETQQRQQQEEASSKKQQEDEQKIQELKKKTAQFEEEIDTLKNDVETFKIQLDTERKDKDEQRRVIEEKSNQDTVHRKGLQVLKRNLDQHIDDLHTWQTYLDIKDKTTFDFETEVRRTLEEELEGKDFVEQLTVLSGKLDQENEAMLKIFKIKTAEQKNAAIEKAKAGSN